MQLVQDRKVKAAFAFWLGTFQFESMPFGLNNAPTVFQELNKHCLTMMLRIHHGFAIY